MIPKSGIGEMAASYGELMLVEGGRPLVAVTRIRCQLQPHRRLDRAAPDDLNGKRDDFTLEDFHACAKTAGLKRGRDKRMLAEVIDAVSRWSGFAVDASVDEHQARAIASAHRMKFAVR